MKKTYKPAEKDSNGLTEKGQAAMHRLIEKFKNSDVSEIAQIISLPLPKNAPCRKWTIRNQILAFGTGGSADCRTGLQWETVGRHIIKDAAGNCGIICKPAPVYERQNGELVLGDNGKPLIAFMRYSWCTVVAYQYTEGLPVEEYEPRQLPPLLNVAERLGVSVKYTPLLDAYGQASSQSKKIDMNTHDFGVFFHELMHIADRQKHPKTKPGQEPEAETVAEFGAAILMHLYCNVDRSGNAWQYIKHYNPDDPIKAVMGALKRVSDALELILKLDCEDENASSN